MIMFNPASRAVFDSFDSTTSSSSSSLGNSTSDMITKASRINAHDYGGGLGGLLTAYKNYYSSDYKNSLYDKLATEQYNSAEAEKEREYNAAEAEKSRIFNSSEAAKDREWQAEQSKIAYERELEADSTKYQRMVESAQNAGINPLYAILGSSAGSISSAAGSGSKASAAAASSGTGARSSNAYSASYLKKKKKVPEFSKTHAAAVALQMLNYYHCISAMANFKVASVVSGLLE